MGRITVLKLSHRVSECSISSSVWRDFFRCVLKSFFLLRLVRVFSKEWLKNEWMRLIHHGTLQWKEVHVWRITYGATAIARWFLLRLPSCGPGSNPKHTTYIFLNLCNWNCNWYLDEEIRKINENEAGIGPYLKRITYTSTESATNDDNIGYNFEDW